MPEENQSAPVTGQPSVAAAPDWRLLNNLSQNQDVKIETPVVEKPQDVKNTDVVTDEKIGEDSEIKIEAPKTDEKPAEEAKEEVKKEPSAEKNEATDSLFAISDVPKTYEEGTFQALAKDLGADLAEESFDAFKEAFVPRAELDKVAKMTKETLFAEYKPEVAAALEMLELGLPQHLILEPTKDIDNHIAILDNAVKLPDAELVRAVLETIPDLTPEDIETELDQLAESGKLAHRAKMERVNILSDKKDALERREAVLNTKNELVQKHTADRQRIEQQKKEQETTLFLKTLNDKSDFMGVPIPKEFKDAVAQKFRGGLYDNELSAAEAKVNTILFRELGGKFSKLIKDSAFAQGKESQIKKAANIPPVTTAGGQKVVNTEPINETANQFDIIREAFGKQ